jgi:predicted transglutaminase-like cysteine proteinase
MLPASKVLSSAALGVLLATAGSGDGYAHRQTPEPRPSAFMRVYGPTLPPFGFVSFCDRHPNECHQGAFEETRIELTDERREQLDHVNRAINRLIEPATDQEIFGIAEYWTLPMTRGDCEDYALLKRQVLMQRGWPASALLITVVRDEKNDGHAILTARTSKGDFILDNKFDDVRPWHAVSYTFIMRQSYINPKVWVSLDSRDSRTPDHLAGVRKDGTRR